MAADCSAVSRAGAERITDRIGQRTPLPNCTGGQPTLQQQVEGTRPAAIAHFADSSGGTAKLAI